MQLGEWTVEVVNEMDEEEYNRELNARKWRNNPNQDCKVEAKAMDTTTSIGAKMMQQMGWKGGGIGKNEDGALEPCEMIIKKSHFGVGYTPRLHHLEE